VLGGVLSRRRGSLISAISVPGSGAPASPLADASGGPLRGFDGKVRPRPVTGHAFLRLRDSQNSQWVPICPEPWAPGNLTAISMRWGLHNIASLRTGRPSAC
jgi:hypothetical protein